MPTKVRKATSKKSAAKKTTAKKTTAKKTTAKKAAAAATEVELVDTGNFPLPDDGPQEDVDQTALPAFDDVLVDGADLEGEE